MKREASLQRFLRKLKQKNLFNENKYDKLYPFGSAPARIYGTPKMHQFSPSDLFRKLRPIVSSIGSFNYNLARFLCDILSLLFLMINQETIDIAINLIFDYNPNLNITKKELKKLFLLLYHRLVLFLTASFITKLME